MARVSKGKLEGKVDSIYRLVLVAAERAKQLSKGAKPLVSTDAKKAPTIALEEILAERVKYESGRSKRDED
jgi:DNA-directed RNA polymerase subunit omega